ncbi:hypothetical protein AKJ16_DCAP11868 [Drosera capensis]
MKLAPIDRVPRSHCWDSIVYLVEVVKWAPNQVILFKPSAVFFKYSSKIERRFYGVISEAKWFYFLNI